MVSESVFATVPEHDPLSLFQKGKPKFQEVVKILELTKEEVAKATGVPPNSVRYDEKIPRILSQRLTEWAILLDLVANHFQGDVDKTLLWFAVPNPLLGNVTPRDMIRFGRFKKLFTFIWNALDEQRR